MSHFSRFALTGLPTKIFLAVALAALPGASPSIADTAPPPDTAGDAAALGAACDKAAGMPATAQVATPDVSLLAQGKEKTEDMIRAAVAACSTAAKANPREGRFEHRVGIAQAELHHPAEAVAALTGAMALGYAGGYDELADARFTGSLAPALPKDPAAGIDIATKGIAATGNPEIKRDLANFLMILPPPFQDQARARKLLEEAVAAHHLPAMGDLAGYLARGVGGFTADKPRAKTLFDEAIAAGSRSSTYSAALLYDNGDGLDRDESKARALYLKAAEEGDLRGMISIGTMMEVGDGGPKDVEGARRWYARGSGMGSLDSRRALANSYLHTDPKETGKGLALMTSAADAGLVEAKYALAEIFKDGIDVEQDPARALEWYRKAAEAGEPKAWERIGSMYDYGEGVPVDHAEARRYFDEAAAAGVAEALTDIGMQYDHGRGVPANVVTAFDWYRKGADKGAAASMSNLGFAYENGRGVKKNLAEALKWYTKAAALDSAVAELNLANMYLDGRGVRQDKLLGLSLLRKAADRKLAQALNDLALMEMKRPAGDGARAMQLLREAAAQHLAVAYLNLAQALADGWDGKQDFVEANFWYQQAIDNPSDIDPLALTESQFHLGENMVLGRGIARDPKKGRALIAAAVRGGNPTARAYMRGRSMPERDLRGDQH